MNRGRLIAAAAGAAVLVGAVLTLRSGVQPPAAPAVGPDGQRIAAYHDPALVTPPQRPGGRPQQPGRLRSDIRRDGALVSWPPAPYGFEVRWARDDGRDDEPDNVRYVASPSTSLAGLDPGRYRVEVRSVDELGRRSEPSRADFEVSGETPSWQQGLGFVDDFTAGANLGPDRWRVADLVRQCVRRESASGPILLDGQCGGIMRPVSPLVLSDPDPAGVRGRVVVLADVPPPPPELTSVEQPPDSGYWPSNELIIGVSPPLPPPEAFDGIHLRLGSRGAYLHIGDGQPDEPPVEHRLDVPPTGSPGALHRWELVFTADELQVYRDGEPIGSIEYRPAWQRADVSLTAFVASENTVPAAARVGLVGFTGPAPDGRATELIELNRGPDQPGAEQRIPIAAAPTAATARLTGLVANLGPTSHSEVPPPPPDLVADVGGRRLELRRRSSENADDHSYWFTADIPVQALETATTLTLRSVDGTSFAAYAVVLELVHEPGTRLDVQPPRVERPSQPALARPRLVLRHGAQTLTSGQPAPRGRLDVEVQLESVAAQATAGELVGSVALRVELADRRILDFPTATDGPAVAGGYRFTLDTGDLPAGYHTLVVSMIPDRPGVANTTERFVVRLTG